MPLTTTAAEASKPPSYPTATPGVTTKPPPAATDPPGVQRSASLPPRGAPPALAELDRTVEEVERSLVEQRERLRTAVARAEGELERELGGLKREREREMEEMEERLREIEEELLQQRRDALRRRSLEALNRITTSSTPVSSSSRSSLRSSTSFTKSFTTGPLVTEPDVDGLVVGGGGSRTSASSLFKVPTLLSDKRSSRSGSVHEASKDETEQALQQFQEEQRNKRLSRQKRLSQTVSPTTTDAHPTDASTSSGMNEDRIDSAAVLTSRDHGLDTDSSASSLACAGAAARSSSARRGLHVDADEVQERQAKQQLGYPDPGSEGGGASSYYRDSWGRFGEAPSNADDVNGSLGATSSGRSSDRVFDDPARLPIKAGQFFARRKAGSSEGSQPPSTISSTMQSTIASMSEVGGETTHVGVGGPLTPPASNEATSEASNPGSVNTRDDLFYTSNRHGRGVENPLMLLSQGRRYLPEFGEDVSMRSTNHPSFQYPKSRAVGYESTTTYDSSGAKVDDLCGDEVPNTTDLDDLDDTPGKEQPIERIADNSQLSSSTPDSSFRSSSPPKDSDSSVRRCDSTGGESSNKAAAADELTWDEAAVTAEKILPVLAQIHPEAARDGNAAATVGDATPVATEPSSGVATSEPPVITLDDLVDSPILDTRVLAPSSRDGNEDSEERNSVTSLASSDAAASTNLENLEVATTEFRLEVTTQGSQASGGAKSDNPTIKPADSEDDDCETPNLRNRCLSKDPSTLPQSLSLAVVNEEGSTVIPTESEASRPSPSMEPARTTRTSADSGSMNPMSNSSTLTTTVAVDYKGEPWTEADGAKPSDGGGNPAHRLVESSSQPVSKAQSILDRVLPAWRGPASRRNSVSSQSPTSPTADGGSPFKWSSRSLSPTKSMLMGASVKDLIAKAEKRDAGAHTDPVPVASKRNASSPLPLADPSARKPMMGKSMESLSSKNAGGLAAAAASALPAFSSYGYGSFAARKEPALYRVKGKRRMYCTVVPMNPASVNSTDVFIFHKGVPTVATPKAPPPSSAGSLYVWIGKNAGPVKKGKALEIANRINDKELRRKADIALIDEESSSPRHLEFWQCLDPSLTEIPRRIPEADPDATDLDFEKSMDASLVLHSLRDQNEEFTVAAASGKQLSSKLINSGGVFVLEYKGFGVFMWFGRHSSEEDRNLGAQFATGLAKQQRDFPQNLPVYLERDAGESVFFMELFPDWSDGVTIEVKAPRNVQVKDRSRFVYDRGGFSIPPTTKLDVLKMLQPPPPPASWDRAAEGAVIEDIGGPPPIQEDLGKLSLAVYTVINSEIVALHEAEHGTLFSGDAYLFQYKHLRGRPGNEKETVMLYSWVGQLSKGTEQAMIAYRASELEKLQGCRHVRVSQGHEPPHFLSIFRSAVDVEEQRKSLTIIRRGTRTTSVQKERGLFQVCGDDETEVKIVETKWKVSSLNRAASFVVGLKDRIYIWNGAGSLQHEQSIAASFAEKIASGRVIEVIKEGGEPALFWQKLSGKDSLKPEDYDSYSVSYLPRRAELPKVYKTRLFRISHVVNGNPTSEEIAPFAQIDLSPNAVFLLDAFFEFYVWVGSEARSIYRDVRLALQTALDYADNAMKMEPLRKLADNTSGGVWLVKSGEETAGFKSCFIAFDDGLEEFSGGFLDIIKRTGSLKTKKKVRPRAEPVAALLEKMTRCIYTVEELRRKDDLPLGVDPAHLEDVS
ncbi:hypothetical protein HDU96_007855 [Phlyctochytrium bullatum]|nr:hypothetical protein HDU96_007855 [Phlyctochytrium bullatum]